MAETWGSSVPDAIHIHEDDWGMWSLYPIAAEPEVERDLAESIAASEKKLHPSGFGWTAIHMIAEPSVDYRELNLLLADAAEKLSAIMPRVKRFAATIGAHIGTLEKDPYGSYENDAWCFGFDAKCFIKLEPEGDFVKGIWYDFTSSDPQAEQAMRHAFDVVNGLVPSLLVDYHQDAQGPLGDPEFLDHYFAEHRERRIAVAKAVEEYRQSSEPKPWWKRLFS